MLRALLAEAGVGVVAASGFVADVGPGGFTGVRVGVTLAKTLAFALGVEAAGVSSFDLISCSGTAVVPGRRGQFLVREAGSAVRVLDELPGGEFAGYGEGVSEASYPDAGRMPVVAVGALGAPERLLPEYVLPPSVTLPRA